MAKKNSNTSILLLAGVALAGFFVGKRQTSSIGSVPKKGQTSEFLARRAKAIAEIYDSRNGMEYKPYSYATVERKVYYDKSRDTFRMEGKGYDYTA